MSSYKLHNKYIDIFKNKPVITYYNDFSIQNKESLNIDKIIVLDTETTGTQACGYDEIIQVGAVWKEKKNNNTNNTNNETNDVLASCNYFTTPLFFEESALINQFLELDKAHKLGDLDVKHQINLIKQAYNANNNLFALANKLEQLVKNKIVVMYNGTSFDANLINKVFGMCNKIVPWACLDCMILAYRLGYEPHNNGYLSYKQKYLGELFGIANEDSHDAVGDCKQLFNIYETLFNKHKDLDFYNVVGLFARQGFLTNRVCVKNYVKNKLFSIDFFCHQITNYLLECEIKDGNEIDQDVLQYIKDNPSLQGLLNDNILENKDKIEANTKKR